MMNNGIKHELFMTHIFLRYLIMQLFLCSFDFPTLYFYSFNVLINKHINSLNEPL
jgi:hypothetical protein